MKTTKYINLDLELESVGIIYPVEFEVELTTYEEDVDCNFGLGIYETLIDDIEIIDSTIQCNVGIAERMRVLNYIDNNKSEILERLINEL